ncbi:putative lipid II flippase FtsW [bacterium c-19]|nr:putative lipid II flippase FtsW [bacterium c-19]
MLSKKCRLLTCEIITLVIIGIVMIASSSRVWAEAKFEDPMYFMKRQLVFAIIGCFVMAGAAKIDLMKIRPHIKKIFIFCVAALVLVLIPGLGVARNGSRSWFGVGSFLIQPSEFFKIAIILYVSDYLAKRYRVKHFKNDLLFPAFLTMVGFGLILLQPDFGSGIVMVCSIVVIVLAADSPIKYFVRIGMLGAAGLGGLILSAPYRLARITSFINPWEDPLGAGFQIIQSLFAISPGGILGVGFDHSMQKHFYLPEPQTDFIFAIFAEEFGFIGCVLLIGLFLLVIYEGVKIALHSNDVYLCYVAIGLISLFAIQVMINLGVVVGLFPVTGITLPFISYGGSSLLVMMGSMGLLMSIANHNT